MSKYPESITNEILQQLSHISDEDLQSDINETMSEIVGMRKEVEGHRLVAEANGAGTPQHKMATFRADAKSHGIEEREAFVAFPQRIQKARSEEKEVQDG
jgi:hypothetical protein